MKLKTTYICIFAFLAVFYIQTLFALEQEKSLWKDDKLYEGEEYDKLERKEKEKVKSRAEEFAMALLMKDRETLKELSLYDGFQLDKGDRINALINKYHHLRGFSCTNIEVISVKLKNRMKEASVAVKVHLSTMDDKGGLSTAPISVETWNFRYDHDEWFFLIEK